MTNIILTQDAEWEPWTISSDEEMVQFARDEEFTYYLWLGYGCVVRKDQEGHLSVLQNRWRSAR